jgi:hypothetical protein
MDAQWATGSTRAEAQCLGNKKSLFEFEHAFSIAREHVHFPMLRAARNEAQCLGNKKSLFEFEHAFSIARGRRDECNGAARERCDTRRAVPRNARRAKGEGSPAQRHIALITSAA